ncbi:MAG: hypothetical protein WC545_04560 [Patescibacteria group bacterium]
MKKSKKILFLILLFLIIILIIFIVVRITNSKIDGTDNSDLNNVVLTAEAPINNYYDNKVDDTIKGPTDDYRDNKIDDLSYNQIIGSDNQEWFLGEAMRWQGKISAYYSQITGIKFCVVDKDHYNIDIHEPCDWFWAFSNDVMYAHYSDNWDGNWVNYILKYYGVSYDQNSLFYNKIYTITGKISHIDCDISDKCIPGVDIISISLQ